MDYWIVRQLRAMVLSDLLDLVPNEHFEQEVTELSSSIENSAYLNRELKWGFLASKLGRDLYYESPLGMSARQVSASELLMNLGMLASAEAQYSTLISLSEKAKVLNCDDRNAGNVARQLADNHIPTFKENIRGALNQYLRYLPSSEQQPFLPLLQASKGESTMKEIDKYMAVETDMRNMFNGAVFGDNATVVVGNENRVKVSNKKGDIDALAKVLLEKGVSSPDVAALKAAIATDDGQVDSATKTFGPAVRGWIGSMMQKAVEAAWQIELGVAGGLLTEALKAYYF